MQVSRLTELADVEQLAAAWRGLAPATPMLTPAWLLAWWENECQGARGRRGKELFVLAVYDAGRLVGLAPWFCERSPLGNRTVRFLGTGRACSDHLSLICAAGLQPAVARAIADWLMSPAGRATWDDLDFAGIDLDDPALANLLAELHGRGAKSDVRSTTGYWQIELPETWEAYLQQVSKNHRKRCRRFEREFLEAGRVEVHVAQNEADLATGFAVLQELHNRRRQFLGEIGAFEDEQFRRFHASALPRLLAAGQLRLAWLTIDGKPAAAEYQLLGGQTLYAYQSGVAPEFLELGAGNLSVLISIRAAIDAGLRVFDLMRGDEEYKAKWGAVRSPLHDVRIRRNDVAGRVRHLASRTNYRSKQWLKAVAAQLL